MVVAFDLAAVRLSVSKATMSDAKATIAARTWSPSSWRSLESLQMASYEAADTPEKIFDKLSKLPPLVQSTEVDALKELLAAAARGERFIVQGGDCAERFMDCETDRLWRQLGVLFQMGEIVSKSTGKGAVRIARIAGQYGKPRSKPTEVVEGHGEIMSFKGDNINGYPVEERKWDPKRLLEGYFHSAATLNYLRGVVSSGGLECLAELDVGHLASRADYADCQAVAKEVQSARGSGCARNSAQFGAIFCEISSQFSEYPTPPIAVTRASSRRTRRCSSTSRRRSRARSAPTTTTCRHTWYGSATAPASSSEATSSARRPAGSHTEEAVAPLATTGPLTAPSHLSTAGTSAGSRTRWGARWGRR